MTSSEPQKNEAARKDLAGTAQTMGRIQRALEGAGVVFIEQDVRNGPGVRLRKPIGHSPGTAGCIYFLRNEPKF